MGEIPDDETGGGSGGLPRDLRFLRTLVTVLTVVMIAGVITITGLLVIRLNDSGAGAVRLIAPEAFELPDGVGVLGISVVDGRTVVVGDDGVIRVFDSDGGAEVATFPVDP